MRRASFPLLGGSLLALSFLACVGDSPSDPALSSSSSSGASEASASSTSSSGASSGETSSGSSGSVDSGADAQAPRRCNPGTDFDGSAAEEVPGLSAALAAARPAAQQWLDATLADDERTMLFSACDVAATNADRSCDLYSATLDVTGAVTFVQRQDALSSDQAYDRHPTMSRDLLRMFFVRAGTLYTSSRTDALGTWGTPSVVATLDYDGGSGPGDTDPFLSRTGNLFFMRGPTQSRSVHYANVAATSISAATQLSPGLTGTLLDPVLADENGDPESLLFIARFEGPHRVIYSAERTGATWSGLTNKYIDSLNVANTSSFVNWVSSDGCRLYFSRGSNASADYKIYVAKRPAL